MLAKLLRVVIVCAGAAVSGCYGGLGPVVAYAPGHGGLGFGAEASAGFTLAHGDVGGVYRPWAAHDADRYVGYLTAEPGFVAEVGNRVLAGGGVTIGVARDGEQREQPVIGGWGTAVHAPSYSACTGSNVAALLSVALGFRFIGGKLELFAAPKVDALGLCPSIHLDLNLAH